MDMAREPELVVHRVRFLAPEAHPIHRVAFSGENIPRLAVSRADSSIEIWASTDGAGYYKRGLIPGRRDVSAESLVWSGKRLFSAGLTGHVVEWDLLRLRPLTLLDSYGGAVWSLALDAAGVTLAAACEDGQVRLFTLVDNSLQFARGLAKQEGRALALAWHPNGSMIAVGGADSTLRKMDVSSGRCVLRITLDQFKARSTAVWDVRVMTDGTIVSADSAGKIQFWSGKYGTLIQSFQLHKADVLTLAMNDDETSIFAAGIDPKIVRLCRVVTDPAAKWVPAGEVRRHIGDIRSLALSHRGTLASGSVDTNFALYDSRNFNSDDFTWYKPNSGNAWRFAVAEEGRVLMHQTGSTLQLWQLGPRMETLANAGSTTALREGAELVKKEEEVCEEGGRSAGSSPEEEEEEEEGGRKRRKSKMVTLVDEGRKDKNRVRRTSAGPTPEKEEEGEEGGRKRKKGSRSSRTKMAKEQEEEDGGRRRTRSMRAKPEGGGEEQQQEEEESERRKRRKSTKARQVEEEENEEEEDARRSTGEVEAEGEKRKKRKSTKASQVEEENNQKEDGVRRSTEEVEEEGKKRKKRKSTKARQVEEEENEEEEDARRSTGEVEAEGEKRKSARERKKSARAKLAEEEEQEKAGRRRRKLVEEEEEEEEEEDDGERKKRRRSERGKPEEGGEEEDSERRKREKEEEGERRRRKSGRGKPKEGGEEEDCERRRRRSTKASQGEEREEEEDEGERRHSGAKTVELEEEEGRRRSGREKKSSVQQSAGPMEPHGPFPTNQPHRDFPTRPLTPTAPPIHFLEIKACGPLNILSSAIASDGRTVALSNTEKLWLYRIADQRSGVKCVACQKLPSYRVAFVPGRGNNSTRIIMATIDTGVIMATLNTTPSGPQMETWPLVSPRRPATNLEVSRDGCLLALLDCRARISVYRLPGAEEEGGGATLVAELPHLDEQPVVFTFVPATPLLALFSGRDHTLFLFDLERETLRLAGELCSRRDGLRGAKTLSNPSGVVPLRVSGCGHTLAVFGAACVVYARCELSKPASRKKGVGLKRSRLDCAVRERAVGFERLHSVLSLAEGEAVVVDQREAEFTRALPTTLQRKRYGA